MMSNQDRINTVQTRQEDVGERIAQFRLSQNLRQRDVARLSGLSVPTISRLESGQGGTLDTLIRVLKALGVEDRLNLIVPDTRINPLEETRRPTKRMRAHHRADKTVAPHLPWTES